MSENFEDFYGGYTPSTEMFGNSSYVFSNASPDTISITGSNLPGGMGDDHITISKEVQNDGYVKFSMHKSSSSFEVPTNTNGFWKYNEDKILKELRDYLGSTYKSHYTSQESKTQTLDLIESIGDAEAFCRSNAIKYLSRFGKKNGKSKMDILKAIHYCILLYHFAGLCNENSQPYETF